MEKIDLRTDDEDVAEPDWVLQPVAIGPATARTADIGTGAMASALKRGGILALCDPGGCNPVLGGAVALAPYPTVVKFLIDRLSSLGSPGALAFRLVSVSAGCPAQ